MAPQILFDPQTGTPYAVTQVLCEDGKRRRADISGKVRSFYRMPAQVKFRPPGQRKQLDISGWVTDDGEGDLLFFVNPKGKHAALFPKKGEE